MFNKKKTALITTTAKTTKTITATTSNSFLNAGLKKSAVVHSENGAIKYSTTGNNFVDEFGKASQYKKPRSFDEVSRSMSTLWAINSFVTVQLVLYFRMITRTVSFFDGSKTSTVQRGQGLRHEGIFRMMWLAIYQPDVFWKNLHLFISVGSWKDIITMLSYDLQYNGWEDRKLDWNKFGQLILAGLENPKTSELIKKYLPQIKTNSICKTIESQADNIIAKWICSLLFGNKPEDYKTYKQYRLLKSSGKAHEWQKLVSQKKFLKINFNTIHGRALAMLVSGKFLKNAGLEKEYEKWIENKPVAKYTGYPYELTATISKATKKYQTDTINAQFMGLVETAKKNAAKGTSLIVVRDTSGSMGSNATGSNVTCFDVAKSLALFFSYMLPEGAFANSFIEFNSDAKMHTWKGSTPVEKWKNDYCRYIGSTDFQSVIRLFAKIKKQGVPESEFPTGILCISDGEFNPTSLNKTNVERAYDVLRNAGFSEEYISNFQIVLWNLARGNSTKFETYGNVKNVFYLSGLDGSIISALTGTEGQEKKAPSTPEELFQAAMNQEVLNKVTL